MGLHIQVSLPYNRRLLSPLHTIALWMKTFFCVRNTNASSAVVWLDDSYTQVWSEPLLMYKYILQYSFFSSIQTQVFTFLPWCSFPSNAHPHPLIHLLNRCYWFVKHAITLVGSKTNNILPIFVLWCDPSFSVVWQGIKWCKN